MLSWTCTCANPNQVLQSRWKQGVREARNTMGNDHAKHSASYWDHETFTSNPIEISFSTLKKWIWLTQMHYKIYATSGYVQHK